MNKLLLIVFIIPFLSSCKGKTAFVYSDKKDTGHYTIKEYYESGQLSFSGSVENAMFIGKKISYYENGQAEEVDSLYKPCELNFCCCDGWVKKYSPNGRLSNSYENKNGVPSGLVTFFSDNSGLRDVTYQYSNGKKNGQSTSYYPSGNVYAKGNYRNDTLVGYQYFFKENGDSLKYRNTFNGKFDFPYKKWLDNGQILMGYYSKKYGEVTYVWQDNSGNEIKRKVEKLKGKNWVMPD